MNENALIDTPIRWILGDPVLIEENIDWTDEWESDCGNFNGEHVEGFIADYNTDPNDVNVQVWEYQNWCRVMVIKSKAYEFDLMAYTCIERSDISAGTLAALEPDLANLIIRCAYIEQLGM